MEVTLSSATRQGIALGLASALGLGVLVASDAASRAELSVLGFLAAGEALPNGGLGPAHAGAAVTIAAVGATYRFGIATERLVRPSRMSFVPIVAALVTGLAVFVVHGIVAYGPRTLFWVFIPVFGWIGLVAVVAALTITAVSVAAFVGLFLSVGYLAASVPVRLRVRWAAER